MTDIKLSLIEEAGYHADFNLYWVVVSDKLANFGRGVRLC